MGYEEYEKPMISATLYYYDSGNCANFEFCQKLYHIFDKYGYNNISNIELGKQELVNGILRDYLVKYGKKELSTIDLKTELLNWINDKNITYISFIHKKRKWICDMTWFKNYKFFDNISVSDYTFNYFTIESSYEVLDNINTQNNYTEMFCELADLFEAFYGRIEDDAIYVEVIEGTKEKVFNPKYLQAIYWGNYFGKDFYLKADYEKLENSYFQRIIQTTNGMFLTLTDNLYDSKNSCNFKERKKY